MKNIKEVKLVLAFLLIAALALVTITPSASLGQTIVNDKDTVQVNTSPVQNDLSTIQSNLLRERSRSLVGDGSDNAPTSYSPDLGKEWSQNAKNLRAQNRKGSWVKRNWWVFPVMAGVGVGVYYLIKNADGGIRCNDGTYSQATNRQGACSWHGGIAD